MGSGAGEEEEEDYDGGGGVARKEIENQILYLNCWCGISVPLFGSISRFK